ncbi:MAG: invasion associated locus B family protein [Alphaproteobacteria bacterium]
MSAFKIFSTLAVCALLAAAPALAQEVIPPTTAAPKPAAAKPAAMAAAKAGAPDKTFGAWKMACAKPDACVLTQRVMLANKGGKEIPGLLAFASSTREKNKEGKVVTVPHIRLIAPLGTFLPNGVGYKIDEAKVETAPFLFCEPRGCMTELPLNAKKFSELKAGKKLQISYSVLETKAPRKISLSLNGLAQGMDVILK